jgi:hypothetical protein
MLEWQRLLVVARQLVGIFVRQRDNLIGGTSLQGTRRSERFEAAGGIVPRMLPAATRAKPRLEGGIII